MIQNPQEIRRLFGEGTVAGLSDAQLLERFVARSDGEAFAAIVARHGVMVLATCRAALGTSEGAEDAFQATFLVLVRRAGTFPVPGSLAGWLYRVARRVARQARIEATRRQNRERVSARRADAEPPRDHALDELRSLIHEELAHLPERYRTTIQLCDLHGLTRDEAAEAIGCPPGTVAGRLARARDQLKGRLARRGVTSPSVVLLGSIGHGPRLFQEATRVALAAARGEGVVPSTAWRLAAGVSRSLFLAQIPGTLVVLTFLAGTGLATAFLALRSEGSPPPPPPNPPPIVRAGPVEPQIPAPIDLTDPAVADIIAGTVVDTAGKPVGGAKIYYIPHPVRRMGLDEDYRPSAPTQVRAVTTSDGRFRFSAKDMTYQSFDGLPARSSGRLIAKADGYGPDSVNTWGRATIHVQMEHNSPPGPEWTLTLAKDDVPIRGRLLDPTGNPLAGATVTLRGLDVPLHHDLDAYLGIINIPNRGPGYDRQFGLPSIFPDVTKQAVTGLDGRFRFEGLGRDRIAHLWINAPGIVADASLLVMTRDDQDFHVAGPKVGPNDYYIHGADFTYTTRPGMSVTGRVIDKATGKPLAGVRMSETMHWMDLQSTDPQGRFHFEGLSPRDKTVTINASPAPGQPYLPAGGKFSAEGEIVVECARGIPYHLMIRDQAGRPVEAEVVYSIIQPNPFFAEIFGNPDRFHNGSPMAKAARQADGSYLGVAIPGPGVVTVKTANGTAYRPAHVDPKGFFAPGRTEWTAQEQITTYGTHNTLSEATTYGGCWEDQNSFEAIVLINPPEDSRPLELTASVVPDRPRQVTLVDPEGKPVVGAVGRGLKYYSEYSDHVETKLRAATFPITGLHPDRSRRMTFVKDDRKLIGTLIIDGSSDAPCTVRMEPWATVTGRIVDEKGQPIRDDREGGFGQQPVVYSVDGNREYLAHADPAFAKFPYANIDEEGRFRAEKLLPGVKYSAGFSMGFGTTNGFLFENLTLKPGEVRDLGDIVSKPWPK